MRFRTVVELAGKTATGLRVPDEVVEGLGRDKRPPVKVTIGGHTYRSTVAVMNGSFLLPLSAENREGAGVKAGDEIDVDVELDEEHRQVEVPGDLAAALDADPKAKAFFDGLSYSRRREIVLDVESAKKPETRQRRIDKAVESCRDGQSYR